MLWLLRDGVVTEATGSNMRDLLSLSADDPVNMDESDEGEDESDTAAIGSGNLLEDSGSVIHRVLDGVAAVNVQIQQQNDAARVPKPKPRKRKQTKEEAAFSEEVNKAKADRQRAAEEPTVAEVAEALLESTDPAWRIKADMLSKRINGRSHRQLLIARGGLVGVSAETQRAHYRQWMHGSLTDATEQLAFDGQVQEWLKHV